MRILMTGAAGNIGSRLMALFQHDTQVDLYTTDLVPLVGHSTTRHLACDIRDEHFYKWVKIIEPDVIIHLASIIQLPQDMSREEAHEIDVKATQKLLNTAIECGVKKIVVTSSGAAYGYYADNPQWLTENMPVRGNDDYFYSSHKRQIEEMLADYREHHPELKQLILRVGTVLGPNFKNPITNMFNKKIVMGIAGSSSPFVISWVDDLVAYLIEGATSDINGVFNVAGDGTLTLKQIAEHLNKSYLAMPALLLKGILGLLKPLGISQYGPEQVKFIQFRPVLLNTKIKQAFKHQPEKNTEQAFLAFMHHAKKEAARS